MCRLIVCLYQIAFWDKQRHQCTHAASVFGSLRFSVKQLKFEIYIILSHTYHSFLLGSENKNKCREINISDSNLLSSSYGNALKLV